MKIVEVKNISKEYRKPFSKKRVNALQNLSFSLDEGDCLGVIGPNGSGKTTLFKCILGFIKKTSGEVTLFNRQGVSLKDFRNDIGFLYEKINIYADLTPSELLNYFGKLYGIDKTRRKQKSLELLKFVDLFEVKDDKVKSFSKGMVQRLAIALTLINDSKLLIFDEPTSGLDPVGIIKITNILKELKKQGKTIILSSHILSHIEDICSDIIILNKGKKIANGKLEDLIKKTNRFRIELLLDNKDNPEDALKKLEEEGFFVKDFFYTNQDLEELFFELIGKDD